MMTVCFELMRGSARPVEKLVLHSHSLPEILSTCQNNSYRVPCAPLDFRGGSGVICTIAVSDRRASRKNNAVRKLESQRRV